MPFGPFINKNHFAGYMELIVPLALGLLLTLSSPYAQALYRREAEGSDTDTDEAPERWDMRRLMARPPDANLAWIATSSRSKAVLLGGKRPRIPLVERAFKVTEFEDTEEQDELDL